MGEDKRQDKRKLQDVRSRNIKPGFFKNPELAECSPHARLLFVGLWLMADREGRLEDRPKFIKVEIFPCESIDVDNLLDELHSRGFAIRYERSGKGCIYLPGFTKHQNPHKNEVTSTLPEFSAEDCELSPKRERSGNKSSTPAESISLLLNPEPIPKVEDVGFELFWEKYPNKVGKPAARSAWNRKKPFLADAMSGLERWMKSPGWQKDNGQYIPHPSTFINQERWNDEPPSAPSLSKSGEIKLRETTDAERENARFEQECLRQRKLHWRASDDEIAEKARDALRAS
ncbi:hypothetical protein QWJ07_03840 [Frankia sp. RB7]|nr:hypothetical protein [Frankia sp. RB7]